MTAIESPRPRPRAFWGDARFFLGILLIAASVAGVWFVVSAARQTVPVFAATRTIVPGEAVAEGDVRVVEVALGQLRDFYLTPGALDEGLVATRTVEAGELVPDSAVGAATAAATTTVVLRSAVDVPASVGAGSVVEVWEAPLVDRGSYDVPRILVPDATVVSVTRDDSVMGGAAASLEVVIPRADVAAVLAAMAAESALSIVPGGGAGR
ncbi:SAF domain-containing protein [Microbacterium sp. BK668]|uniref:SAF domain-containing protein n=1 Tax=Microbacterium sp. BK668 TaxID=2512118 RepID=UPI00105B5F60|nr:SAF domain-containing protein [Microbacterium sp. BK668]